MDWYLKCWQHYFDFSGRARRKEYWMFFLFNLIFSFVFGFLDGFFGWVEPEIGLGLLGGIYSIAVLIPGLSVSVRRLHDIGKSGWNYFIILIPFVGAIIFLVWLCKEGESGSNAWGEDPKMNEDL